MSPGVGGTSWAAVRCTASSDPIRKSLCQTYLIGYPNREALRGLSDLPEGVLKISSGGLRDGLDVAKSIAMGADLAGFARKFINRGKLKFRYVKRHHPVDHPGIKVAMFVSGAMI